MVIDVIRFCQRGQGCDIIVIRGFDGREAHFKRAFIPDLIRELEKHRKRNQAEGA